MKLKVVAFLLVTLVCVASFFYRLDDRPITLCIYEGPVGLKAMKMLKGDFTKLWDRPTLNAVNGSSYSDRDPFLMYPVYVCFKIWGTNYHNLRMPSAVFGMLSVLAMFLFMRSMTNVWVGAIAAVILSVTSWMMILSRVAMDYSATIFFFVFCLWIYSLTFKCKTVVPYIILGAILALFPYFYLVSRVVPIIIATAFLLRVVLYRGYLKKFHPHLLLCAIVFVGTMRLMGTNPIESYTKMIKWKGYQSWVWVTQSHPKHYKMTTGESVIDNIKFTFEKLFSSWGWEKYSLYERHSGFDKVTILLFLIGLLYAIFTVNSQKSQLLLISLALSVMPQLLTAGHAHRLLYAIVPVVALAANGLWYTARLLKHPVAVTALIVPVLVTIIHLNWLNYFGEYCVEKGAQQYIQERKKQIAQVMDPKNNPVQRGEYGWAEGLEYNKLRLKK